MFSFAAAERLSKGVFRDSTGPDARPRWLALCCQNTVASPPIQVISAGGLSIEIRWGYTWAIGIGSCLMGKREGGLASVVWMSKWYCSSLI